ncbi:MAG: PAS domain S-box protein [candidate division Zixibacteria bacterium]|nr:PAS domain S-box protein [candidate division Zixibacteria bacterium]
MSNSRDLEKQNRELLERIRSLDKINKSLMNRVERSVDNSGNAFSLFESNILLQNAVNEKTRELETVNEKLLKEIEERKQAEETLRESEGKLRTLFDNAADLIAVVDTRGRFIDLSRKFEEESGYKKEEMIGKNVITCGIVSKKSAIKLASSLGKLLRFEEIPSFEVEGVRKDGGIVNYELKAVPIVRDNKIIAIQAILRNIEDRKRAESERLANLERAERQQSALLRLLTDDSIANCNIEKAIRLATEASAAALKVERTSIWLLSKDRTILECVDLYESNCSEHTSGATLHAGQYPNYFKALTNERAINADDARTDPRTREFTENYLKPLGITSMIDCAIRVSGRVLGVLCIEHVGKPRRWKTDEISFSSQIADQIAQTLINSERKAAEDSLRESEARFRSVTNSAHDAIVIIDSSGSISFWNKAAAATLGYSDEEAIGKEFSGLLLPERFYGKYRSELLSFQKTGNSEVIGKTIEILMVKKGGDEIPIELSLSSLQLKGEWHAVGIARDISERKQREEINKAHRDLSIALGSVMNFEEALRLSLTTTIRITNMDCGAFYFQNDEGGLDLITHTGITPGFAERVKAFAPDAPETNLVLAGEPVYWDRGCEELKQLNGNELEGLVSSSVIPIHHEGKVIASMNIGSHTLPSFPQLGRSVAEAIAAQMGDVLARLKIGESLKESEERFRNVSNSANDAIIILRRDGTISFWNKAAEKIFGYSSSEASGKKVLNVLPTESNYEDYKELLNEFNRNSDIKSDGKTIELAATRSNGDEFPIELSMSSVKLQKEWHIVGIIRDISERKKAEEELRATNELNQRILATAATAVFTVDTESRITSINEAFKSMTGYDEEDLIGKTCAYLKDEDCDEVCHLFKIKSPKRIVKAQRKIKAKDGRSLTILKNGDTLRDETGKVVGGIESFVDVTDLIEARESAEKAKRELEAINRQLEETIKHANQMAVAAEAANKAKSEFLANMSHEIRTPMNGIIGMTELALETELNEEQHDYLTTVKNSAESLLTIINDILDFSKVEAGLLELEEIEFSLRETVESTLDTLTLKAHEKGLELVNYIHPLVPDRITGDPTRLRQIMLNLIGNAIKFTDEGEIVFRVELESDPENGLCFHFSVSDTGIGIPDDRKQDIFKSFTQADGSTTRKFGGTGLGTTISKKLVELMGGEIWLESPNDPNRKIGGPGTTFHFRIAFKCDPGDRGLRSSSPPELTGLKTLVIDDNETNRKLLRTLLENWGLDAHTVDNGKDGLAQLKTAATTDRPFELLLLDVLMPSMDGFMVVERIRADKDLAHLRIIILTSAGKFDQAKNRKDLSVNSILMKPIKQSMLFDMIVNTVTEDHNQKEAKPELTKESSTPDKSLNIILAEDNRINQKIAVHLLEKQQHSVTVVENGKEVLELLGTGKFDLILMDVQMPVMNGLEASKQIRTEEKNTSYHIPIVAMTAHALKGDRERCLEAGMDEYLSKPIKAAELQRVIAKVMGSSELSESENNHDTERSDVEVWNPNEALAQLDDDQELLKEMALLFIDDLPKLMGRIEEAVIDGDHDKLERLAHTLKGSVSHFSARQVHGLAQQLEEMGRENKLEQSRAVLEELRDQTDELSQSLRTFVQNQPEADEVGDLYGKTS